jgi:peptidoglycan hydrolase CwlO-like protein
MAEAAEIIYTNQKDIEEIKTIQHDMILDLCCLCKKVETINSNVEKLSKDILQLKEVIGALSKVITQSKE